MRFVGLNRKDKPRTEASRFASKTNNAKHRITMLLSEIRTQRRMTQSSDE